MLERDCRTQITQKTVHDLKMPINHEQIYINGYLNSHNYEINALFTCERDGLPIL